MISSSARPSATAVFPRVRAGTRWLNLLWMLPIVAVALGLIIGVSMWLRTLPEIQDFIRDYPGNMPSPVAQGFPWWLRWQHLLNAIFLVPIIRAGLQIWAGRPRLYTRSPGLPGADWARIQHAMPAEGGWSMRDDAVALHPQVGLPGKRYSTGLARFWHLGVTLLWVANGVLFYILLFATGQWVRIVPTTVEVFPQALSSAIQFGSLNFPAENSWVSYNGLQLLTYFVTVFIAAPLAVLTGVMHAPRIAKRTTNSRFFNVEVVRSVHVLVLGWFVIFTIAHVSLVLLTGAATNLNHITFGTNDGGWAGIVLFAVAVVVGAVAWLLASRLTLRYPEAVRRVGTRLLGPLGRFY